MKVDDFNGERVETEDASGVALAGMDADYTKYLAEGPGSFYGGKSEFDHFVESHEEVKWEINQRKADGVWSL